jgi:hypothetical protein
MDRNRRPAELAQRTAKLIAGRKGSDIFRRETFALPRVAAREKARSCAASPRLPTKPRSKAGACCRATKSSSPCAGCRARTEICGLP